MLLSGFRIKNIKRKTLKLLKNKLKHNSLNVSKSIKSVGIIVNEGSGFNFDKLKQLQKKIGSGSDNFSVLTCKEIPDGVNEFRGVVFTKKDFNWRGKLQAVEVKEFLNKPFDMLIDYTKAADIYKKYLIAASKATFKVGFANIDQQLFDLMIDVDNDITLFNEELIKYLKILKKL